MLFSCIFSIGKEIINGSINDTNSFYISSELTKCGIDNRYIVSIDDNENDIIESLRYYLDKVDILITTGGLGPTFDDITIETISKALKKELKFDRDSYEHIKTFYNNLYKNGKISSSEINEKRKKMAYIPSDAKVLKNYTGAASGIYIKENNKHIFCLPGIPREMKPMFEKEVIPIIQSLSTGITINKVYKFSINDETVLGQFIDKIKENGVYIKSLPVDFDSKTMEVRFTASGKNETECLKKIEYTKKKLEKQISEYN